MGKIAIHGFGRIGRTLLRIGLKNNLFVPTSISDIRDIPTFAALFEVDTNYGRWHEEVKATDKGFNIGGRDILYFDSMKELPDWKGLGIDLVIDCTGRATTPTCSCSLASIWRPTIPRSTRSSAWPPAPPTRSPRW